MKAWIIHEPKYGSEDRSYETYRLIQECEQSPAISSVFDCSVQDVGTIELSGGEALTFRDEPVRELPDFVLVRGASIHEFPQWHSILDHFERNGVLCVNDYAAINLTANKYAMWQRLSRYQLPTPDCKLLGDNTDPEALGSNLGWPMVLKQVNGTQGSGVALAHSPSEFNHLVQEFRNQQPRNPIKAQRFLDSSYGRDVRVLVVGTDIVASMLRTAARTDEFRSNVSLGAIVTAYPLCRDGSSIALAAARALGLNQAGVDLLFGPNGFEICEVNKAPDFKGMEKACTSVNIARALVDECIRLTQEHRAKGSPVWASAAFRAHSLIHV
jgi:RimK family alpha-L-glutamate ligase